VDLVAGEMVVLLEHQILAAAEAVALKVVLD
jgi:hypothetical protein